MTTVHPSEGLVLDTKTPPTEKKIEYSRPFKTCLPQFLATMAQGMLLLALGMLICAPTVVIAALNNSPTSPLSLTNSQASWFAGILLIMQPLGSVLSGVSQETLGRKKCMLMVNIPQITGWLLIHYASTVSHLFAAALFMGFSVGFMEAPTLSYVGEISQPHLRGVLTSFTSVYTSSGMLLMYLMGTFTDWRTAAALSTVVPVLTFIAILQVPESPVWLLLKNRDAEALEALQWLRGWVTPTEVAAEFELIRDHAQASRQVYTPLPTAPGKEIPEVRKPNFKEKMQDLLRPEMIRPFRLVVLYFGFLHCAALNGARPYLIRVFTQLGTPVKPFVATVVAAVCQILGSILLMAFVQKVGKRRLSLGSMLACSTIILTLGVYSLLHQNSSLNLSWLPLLLMSLLFFCTNLGIGVIPWTLLSEVFPARGRGIGGGASAAFYYFWFFLVTKTWLDLEALVQLHGVLFFYSGMGFLGVVFLYLCLPETEGHRLEEIEEMFKRQTSMKKVNV